MVMGKGVFHNPSQNHKITQAGRNLRRSLAQPPAQSKVDEEVSLGCSEIYGISKDINCRT